ncbi:response regulator [Dechloromonas sp. ZY10]|uniref:response regulator n=1 Tax=Dechloromonas aquae TaxID=2664436 RepID=UPI0035286704
MNKNKRTPVLIVDDNDMMRSVLRGILRGDEYEVIGEGRNGLHAVEMTKNLLPWIVCLDVQMPEKDGLTALAEIKAAQPKVQVVMITASADGETVKHAVQSGASGFIVKPFNAANVLKALEKARQRYLEQATAKTPPPTT